MADNLDLPQVAANQDQKEVTINDAFTQLSGALDDFLAVSMASGNVTLSSTNFQQYMGFNCSGSSSAVTLTLPAIKRALFYVENNNTAILTVAVGSTTLELGEGIIGYFQTDGTTNGLISAAPGVPLGTTERDFPVNYSGGPGASQEYNIIFNRALQLPESLTGSNFYVGTHPTVTATFTLYKNGSSIGTVAISTAGAFTVSFASLVSFAVGDVFRVTAPTVQDATLSDVSFDFLAYLT